MSNIEAIIIDGVRYDKIKVNTCLSCKECELARECEIKGNSIKFACYNLTNYDECWKRKEE